MSTLFVGQHVRIICDQLDSLAGTVARIFAIRTNGVVRVCLQCGKWVDVIPSNLTAYVDEARDLVVG